MKHWKTYFWIMMLVLVSMFAFSKRAKAEQLPEYEPYPGTRLAVSQVFKSEKRPMGLSLSAAINGELEHGEKKRAQMWLYIGGFSHHDTGGKPNTNKEENFGLGGAITTEQSFYGVRPIVQGMHVFKNSKKGTTDVLGLGLEACIESTIDLCGSVSRVYATATDPRKNRRVSAWGYMPTVGLGKGNYRIYATLMAPKVYYVYFAIGF